MSHLQVIFATSSQLRSELSRLKEDYFTRVGRFIKSQWWRRSHIPLGFHDNPDSTSLMERRVKIYIVQKTKHVPAAKVQLNHYSDIEEGIQEPPLKSGIGGIFT